MRRINVKIALIPHVSKNGAVIDANFLTCTIGYLDDEFIDKRVITTTSAEVSANTFLSE